MAPTYRKEAVDFNDECSIEQVGTKLRVACAT